MRFLGCGHTALWDNEECDPRGAAALVYTSLAEFVLRIAESKYIPIDSLVGARYRELLDEMGA